MSWSRTKSILVVGMTKGVVFVYHHQQRRKIPVEVKHTKTITAVEWVDDDHFVLASDDKQVSNTSTFVPKRKILCDIQLSLNSAIDGQCISTIGFKQHLSSLSCIPDQKNRVSIESLYHHVVSHLSFVLQVQLLSLCTAKKTIMAVKVKHPD